MSSNAYSAEIFPDPRLRRIVIGTGVLLGASGIFLLALLPVHAAVRVAAAMFWAAMVGRELRRLWRAWAACCAYRFTPGNGIFVRGPDRVWRPVQWLPGGILLRNIGWIRLRSDGMGVFAELLRGDGRSDPGWRRLQVIWRHVGASA